ncbi:MAG TPA: ankyrin repeat domain-containing protein [Allosphingosinicella sp.]|nr:ankyrin repeat domain-containing protein [Allosphingosinicella sp.]
MARTKTLLLAAALAAIAVPVAAQSFSEGYTFLKAVRERDGNTAERILSNPSSTAINHRDASTGENALHILVRGRDSGWLAYMLGRGARADVGDREGNTPLIIAAQLGWLEGAEILLGRGRANVNQSNNRGETPLIFAVHRRDMPMVRMLLRNRADPNQTDHVAGNSAIDYARQDNRATGILRLLENPQAATPTVSGLTPPTPRP